MITENDKIAIGVSGGKDSLMLLYALSGLRSFYPVPFELVAIAVDLGYEDFDLSPVKALCDELSVAFYVVKMCIRDRRNHVRFEFANTSSGFHFF